MSAVSRHERLRRAVACMAAVLSASVSSVTSTAQSATSTATAAQVTRVDALFADFKAAGSPGAAVAVVRNGAIAFAKGYGLADIENGVAVTPATSFRLASVTKQFTAAAILTLVEAGTLGLDDRLGELLPDVPAYARDVTVRQMLAHTSGVPDYEPLLGKGDGPQISDRDVLALLRKAKHLYFRSGTSWRYSNSAYALLSLVVEQKSGVSFAAYLRQRIFDRAGMATAVAHVDGADAVANRAYGHSKDGTGWRRTDQNRTSAVLGDGGIYASAEELARWTNALDANAVMSAATFASMVEPQVLPSGAVTSYGFGWFLDKHHGRRRQRHEGDSIGFRTAIQRYPDDRLTVIVLTNRGAAPIDGLSDGVANIFLAP
ncbi:MAG TPA: serine hydrolase domain-containing protein [Gemmatimonadaceae bacterium]|nr:serine hydrolase domain-containing protein [Gemmatimonadaceae bacterium]